MEEEHVHNFPRSGNGCYCGAKQCEHSHIETKPGYRPWKVRCKEAAVPGSSRCLFHKDVSATLAVGGGAR